MTDTASTTNAEAQPELGGSDSRRLLCSMVGPQTEVDTTFHITGRDGMGLEVEVKQSDSAAPYISITSRADGGFVIASKSDMHELTVSLDRISKAVFGA